MEARFCTHGNNGSMKEYLRMDSATAQYDVMRILLSLTNFIIMRPVVVDINRSYMQSEPIKRDIYVRPSKEMEVR